MIIFRQDLLPISRHCMDRYVVFMVAFLANSNSEELLFQCSEGRSICTYAVYDRLLLYKEFHFSIMCYEV